MGLGRVVCYAVAIAWIAGLCQANRTSAATPPLAESKACSGKPCGVPKPADLPLRVPWKAGESYPFGDWGYNRDNTSPGPGGSDHICNDGKVHGDKEYPFGSMDCYALDFVEMTTNTQIYPAFGGTVVFSGCATGGWATYGRVVFIETVVDGKKYEALYTHLSSTTSDATTGRTIDVNAALGTAGSTYTAIDQRDKDENGNPNPQKGKLQCSLNDLNSQGQPTNVHLHFAVYRGATFKDGPTGGTAVIPEPFVGLETYENFQWWHPKVKKQAMMAVDLVDGTGKPTGDWSDDQSKKGPTPTPVPSDKPVRFRVHVEDKGAALKEVHFTVYYPGWNDPTDTRFPDFPSKQIWRIVAVCRHGSFTTVDGSCKWKGDDHAADVTYDWYPGKNPTASAVDWLPKSLSVAAAAKTTPNTDKKGNHGICVSFDVVSAAGTQMLAPGGVDLANCGLDKSSKAADTPQIVPSGTKTAGMQPGPASSLTDPAMVTEDVVWMPIGLAR